MQKIVLDKKVIFYKIGDKNITNKYLLLQTLAKDAFGVDLIIEKKSNKPYIFNHKDLYCSVSDSKDMLFVALCKDSHIGVDVEFLRPRKKELLRYLCNKEERNILMNFFKNKNEIETIIWSIKESAQKSDTTIFDPKKYVTTICENNLLKIKRNNNVWTCSTFTKDSYFFSISVKENMVK